MNIMVLKNFFYFGLIMVTSLCAVKNKEAETLAKKLHKVKRVWGKHVCYYYADIIANGKTIGKVYISSKKGYLTFYNQSDNESNKKIKLPDEATQRYLKAFEYYRDNKQKKLKKL